MATRAVSGFQISGYFSRIFGRKTDKVKDLATKVRTSQEAPFQGLRATYQAFGRAKTPGNSIALAKEIVKVAIQEAGPRGNVVEKTKQVTTAVLSNWVMDGKRNTLAADVRTELQTHLAARQAEHNRGLAQRSVATFTKGLESIQSRSPSGNLRGILDSKKRDDLAEIARLERDPAFARLEEVQDEYDRYGSVIEPDWSYDGGGISEATAANNKRVEAHHAEWEPALREAQGRVRTIRGRISELRSATSGDPLMALAADARRVIDRARSNGIEIQPADLIPANFTAESRQQFLDLIQ